MVETTIDDVLVAEASEAAEAEEISPEVESELEVEEAVEAPTVPFSAYSNGLIEAEIYGLLFMREEENLPHDVYLTLYEAWGLPLVPEHCRQRAIAHGRRAINYPNRK